MEDFGNGITATVKAIKENLHMDDYLDSAKHPGHPRYRTSYFQRRLWGNLRSRNLPENNLPRQTTEYQIYYRENYIGSQTRTTGGTPGRKIFIII